MELCCRRKPCLWDLISLPAEHASGQASKTSVLQSRPSPSCSWAKTFPAPGFSLVSPIAFDMGVIWVFQAAFLLRREVQNSIFMNDTIALDLACTLRLPVNFNMMLVCGHVLCWAAGEEFVVNISLILRILDTHTHTHKKKKKKPNALAQVCSPTSGILC